LAAKRVNVAVGKPEFSGAGCIMPRLDPKMPIRRLPDEVSSAIAAGEVIERPASVVKELVENSLDAGAGSIEIQIEGGGIASIMVADNGGGIPAKEVVLAVSRFTTSKLSSVEDLYRLHTLGFRGEALASIGAVSRLELITRERHQGTGVRLTVDGDQVGKLVPMAAQEGTVVRVRDLFFNVPARRKFLKSPNTERRRILRLVSRYALAYPQVRFRLISEGRESFATAGNGDRVEILAAVYGPESARTMIPVMGSGETPYRVSGYLAPPNLTRSTRGEISLFINGRWIQDPSLTAAVIQAYHALIMVGRFPLVALFVEVPPAELDVNVHPAKAEVRFANADRLFSVVQRVLRATLLGQWTGPQLEVGPTWSQGGGASAPAGLGLDWSLTHPELLPERAPTLDSMQELPAGVVPLLRAVGQVGASYLVAEGPDGIYLIDQHAAHERVLFERLMAQVKSGQLESQTLLEGITVELPAHQIPLLQENAQIMQSLGFEIEEFGPQAFRLRAVPAVLQRMSPERALWAVVDDLDEDETPLAGELEARVAARVCKAAAVKAGQVLSLAEQEQLLRDLELCQTPRTCPHGRPTMIHLSVAALERQFGRRG
jgi:DNA mismatch repair protein MutL